METNSFSTNKIVSILIAVIVAACVLIPICNEFGNNGGDSPSPLASEVWKNPGSPMSEIDLSDHSNTYTFSIDDGYEDGTVLIIAYNVGDDMDLFPDLVGVYYYNGGFYLYEEDAEPSDSLEVKWDSEDDRWHIKRGNRGNSFDNPKIFTYDENGEYWGTMCWTDPDYEGIIPSISDIRLTQESDYEIIVNIEYAMVEEYIVNGESVRYIDDYAIESPQIQINNMGEIIISGDMTIDIDGEIEFIPNSELMCRVGGIIPKTVEIGGSDSDSGITGTLITLIPVFVVLGILGSVAYMIFGRNEITQ